ncbi:hypothetical protein Tco_1494815, partial [Tanacetum coccineum]
MLDSQLNANDKAGLGHDGAKESKVSETITSVSKVETSNSKTSNDKVEMPKIETVRMSEPIIEEWESDSEDDEIVVKPKEVTKTVKPSFEKIESVNARNETVRQAENSRKNNKGPRGNKRNWNGMITQKLVNTINGTRVNTTRPKAEVNTVKALASWVWKPKHEELVHVSKSNSASKTLTKYDYVDALVTKKIVLEGVSDKQQVIRVWRSGYSRNIWQLVKKLGFRSMLPVLRRTVVTRVCIASLIAVNTA